MVIVCLIIFHFQPVVFRFVSFKQIPDLKDTEAVQRFFLQEVQLGEELLATGS